MEPLPWKIHCLCGSIYYSKPCLYLLALMVPFQICKLSLWVQWCTLIDACLDELKLITSQMVHLLFTPEGRHLFSKIFLFALVLLNELWPREDDGISESYIFTYGFFAWHNFNLHLWMAQWAYSQTMTSGSDPEPMCFDFCCHDATSHLEMRSESQWDFTWVNKELII